MQQKHIQTHSNSAQLKPTLWGQTEKEKKKAGLSGATMLISRVPALEGFIFVKC